MCSYQTQSSSTFIHLAFIRLVRRGAVPADRCERGPLQLRPPADVAGCGGEGVVPGRATHSVTGRPAEGVTFTRGRWKKTARGGAGGGGGGSFMAPVGRRPAQVFDRLGVAPMRRAAAAAPEARRRVVALLLDERLAVGYAAAFRHSYSQWSSAHTVETRHAIHHALASLFAQRLYKSVHPDATQIMTGVQSRTDNTRCVPIAQSLASRSFFERSSGRCDIGSLIFALFQ